VWLALATVTIPSVLAVFTVVVSNLSPTALLPEQIISFFEPIFNSAKELDRAYKKFSSQIKAPFITVSFRTCSVELSAIPYHTFFLLILLPGIP